MLLGDLVGVIELLKERIATHGTSLRENETRTRMALIDPLLQALGWDTSDPSMVLPEYSVSGRADYALLNADGRPVAFIEAKHLGEPLEKHEPQMFTYAVMEPVDYAGLTDGSRWNFYNVFDRSGAERRILQVSLADIPSYEAALKLLLLWRPNLAAGQPVAANEPVLVVPPNPIPPPPSPDDKESSTPDPGNWVALGQIGQAIGKPSPTAIRFDNGPPRSIKSWWQVFHEVAEWLVQRGILTADKLPIAGIASINSSPFGPSGKPFEQAKEVSGGIFIRAKQSSEAIVKSSSNLLQHFHANSVTVELQFE